MASVLVINRFRVADSEAQTFRERLATAHETLAACRGYVSGEVGRNLDEPTLWSLVTHWENVGAYRRALSSYDGKLKVAPVLGQAIDESSAYEPVRPGETLNVQASRGDS